MRKDFWTLLGLVNLLVGTVLVMCLPYSESFPFWNARMGGLIGILMIVMGIAFIGIGAEKRR